MMKKNRLKAMSSTAQKIKCKVTGLKLIEADSSRDNSRAFYKLPNGEYLSRNTEAMKNDYKCCSYCTTFLKDCSHKFFFEHYTEKGKYCCTSEKCMFKYLLESHSKLNSIVS